MIDPYALLGVTPASTPAEAKAAFRRLCLLVHPDRGGSDDDFKTVLCAYEFVSEALRDVARFGARVPSSREDLEALRREFTEFHETNARDARAKWRHVTDHIVGRDRGLTPEERSNRTPVPDRRWNFDREAFIRRFDEQAAAGAEVLRSTYEGGYGDSMLPSYAAAGLEARDEIVSAVSSDAPGLAVLPYEPVEDFARAPPQAPSARSGFGTKNALRNYEVQIGAGKQAILGSDYAEAHAPRESRYVPEPEGGYAPLPSVEDLVREREDQRAQLETAPDQAARAAEDLKPRDPRAPRAREPYNPTAHRAAGAAFGFLERRLE